MAENYRCTALLGDSEAPSDFIANLVSANITNCPVSWFKNPEYIGKDSYFGGSTPLDTWVGYLVVVGFGLLFSIFTTIVVYLDKTFAGNASIITSENFK